MNVRWMAVLTGFLVDYLISSVLLLVTNPGPLFYTAPDPTQFAVLLLICLTTLSSGVGGYVAGRMAGHDRALHGLLVGAVGVLAAQFATPLPRLLVLASAACCLVAALGGFLSRYPPQHFSLPPDRQ